MRINIFSDYLKGLKRVVDNPKAIPRVSQAFLLSYFWEIQSPEKWPVLYGSSRKVLEGLGLDFESYSTHGDEYLAYVDFMDEIRGLFESINKKSEQHPTWFTEHVLWRQFNQVSVKSEKSKKKNGIDLNKGSTDQNNIGAEQGWIPPIILDLPDLSENRETAWSKQRELKPEKAFETKLRYAFTLLGYQTIELGQGTGREPDGVALSVGVQDGDYAIVFDAKARENEYSLGTDDRSIVEYIKNKHDELQKQRIRKMAFVIVSSSFSNSERNRDTLLNVYRSTRVPVILLCATDLLYLIELKLKDVEIDHARMENLFLETGLLPREKIMNELSS